MKKKCAIVILTTELRKSPEGNRENGEERRRTENGEEN